MRAPSNVITLALLAGGCRIVSFGEVPLPVEGPTFVVECNYELGNCLRRAEQHCDGKFEQITRKNCRPCGKQVPLNPQVEAPFQLTSYRGTLYFRCM